MTNVTPGPPQPRGVTTPTPISRQNQLIILAVFVVVLVLLVKACAGGENRYEKIAHQLTQAAQNNNLAEVQKLENIEAAAEMSKGRLGRASDVLAPLGTIKHVKEVTPPGGAPRVHAFEVTFDNGSVHEEIQFDPADKVVSLPVRQTDEEVIETGPRRVVRRRCGPRRSGCTASRAARRWSLRRRLTHEPARPSS